MLVMLGLLTANIPILEILKDYMNKENIVLKFNYCGTRIVNSEYIALLESNAIPVFEFFMTNKQTFENFYNEQILVDLAAFYRNIELFDRIKRRENPGTILPYKYIVDFSEPVIFIPPTVVSNYYFVSTTLSEINLMDIFFSQ